TGQKVVSGVKRPGFPQIDFDYCEKSKNHERRVIKRHCHDGSFLETHYFAAGSNHVGSDRVIHIKHKKHAFARNCVREQKAPVGPNDQLWTTHRYFYNNSDSNSATVKDAHDTITHYKWDDNQRLKSISKFDAEWHLLLRETFTWNQGHLTTRT